MRWRRRTRRRWLYQEQPLGKRMPSPRWCLILMVEIDQAVKLSLQEAVKSFHEKPLPTHEKTALNKYDHNLSQKFWLNMTSHSAGPASSSSQGNRHPALELHRRQNTTFIAFLKHAHFFHLLICNCKCSGVHQLPLPIKEKSCLVRDEFLLQQFQLLVLNCDLDPGSGPDAKTPKSSLIYLLVIPECLDNTKLRII